MHLKNLFLIEDLEIITRIIAALEHCVISHLVKKEQFKLVKNKYSERINSVLLVV